jgi:hypothetical protein
MKINNIAIGGWFQRTTLHLTEVWDFLKYGKSELDFPPETVQEARGRLRIKTIERRSGPLEYIEITTEKKIQYRIYEDGLIILEKKDVSFPKDLEEIRIYYEENLSKTLSFIFSKGAPVPKELADIKTILPFILTAQGGTVNDVKKLFGNLKETIYSITKAKKISVYRGSGLIVIHNLKDQDSIRSIIESQIFFREFKTQLHRYLMIHRNIWEKIASIKEQHQIKGANIDDLRNQLADYEKTVNLIGARIDQMDVYLKTRQKLTDLSKIGPALHPLFQFKFETLEDTLNYIRHLWKMTTNYLHGTVELINELQGKSTKNTISSLQLITTIGVVAAILGYLGKVDWPQFTYIGLIYFIFLLGATWIINKIVSEIYRHKKYPIKTSKIVSFKSEK